MSLYVYAIRAVEACQVKIGCSANPQARLAGFRAGNGSRLELAATARVVSSEVERELHHRLAAYRLQGEWFRETPEVLAAIEELRAMGSPWTLKRGPGPDMEIDPLDEAAKFMTVAQARKRLNVIRAAVYARIDSGVLAAHIMYGMKLVATEDIEAWITERTERKAA